MILVLGDLLIDKYRYCDVSRVSPEAPCLIGKELDNPEEVPGGAANVAYNIAKISKDVMLVGACSNNFVKMFKGKFPLSPLLSDSDSVKTRFIDKKTKSQLFRFDQEKENPPLTDNYLKFLDSFEYKNCNVCVLVDYQKGMLKGNSVKKVRGSKINIVSTKRKRPHEIVPGRYKKKRDKNSTNILILNNHEYSEIKEVWDYDYIVRTEGDKGITLLKVTEDPESIDHKEDILSEIKGIPVEVFDVTGAGDTVTAVVAWYLDIHGAFKEENLIDACFIANHVASQVVRKHGTTTLEKMDLDVALEELKGIKNEV